MTYKTSQEYNQELVVHNHREAIVYGQHNKPHNRRLNYELHILIQNILISSLVNEFKHFISYYKYI